MAQVGYNPYVSPLVEGTCSTILANCRSRSCIANTQAYSSCTHHQAAPISSNNCKKMMSPLSLAPKCEKQCGTGWKDSAGIWAARLSNISSTRLPSTPTGDWTSHCVHRCTNGMRCSCWNSATSAACKATSFAVVDFAGCPLMAKYNASGAFSPSLEI